MVQFISLHAIDRIIKSRTLYRLEMLTHVMGTHAFATLIRKRHGSRSVQRELNETDYR